MSLIDEYQARECVMMDRITILEAIRVKQSERIEKAEQRVKELEAVIAEAYHYMRLEEGHLHTAEHGFACGEDLCAGCLVEVKLRAVAGEKESEK